MKRRIYWGMGLIALAMLFAHLAILSMDTARTAGGLLVHAILMFGWSLILAFAMRGEIGEIKHSAGISVVFHIIVVPIAVLVGESGLDVSTAFGTISLASVLLALSGLIWAALFAVAGYQKKNAARLDAPDLRELLLNENPYDVYETEEPPRGERLKELVEKGQQTSIELARHLKKLDPSPAISAANKHLAAFREARAAAKAPATFRSRRTSHTFGVRLLPYYPDPSAAKKAKPAAKPKAKAPTPVATLQLRPEDMRVAPLPFIRARKTDLPKPRPKAQVRAEMVDLSTALSAESTVEAVSVINRSQECWARLGIRNRGRFIDSAGRAQNFTGLDQLKELVRAELKSVKSA